MAKLEIKLKEEAKKRAEKQEGIGNDGFMFNDYDILIDGQEPSHLLDFKLEMGVDVFNTATISFHVEDLKVDADALASLKAFVKTEE